MIKIVLLLALVGVAVVSASDYESSYSKNYYAPIYSMNSNPNNRKNNNGNQNTNLIKNSYYSNYGVKGDGYGYGKGSPYYGSKYYSCVQNNNNLNRNRNNNGIGNLIGLLGGCNDNGGNLGAAALLAGNN